MARTKQTGRANAKPNGTNATPAAPPPTAPSPLKSPAQPTELSEEDRLKLKNWLDRQERAPFNLLTVPVSRKRKRTNSGQLQLQTDIFEPRLDVQYEVRPRDKWEALRRYKKFTVGSESIAVGQCILVKHDDSEDAKIDVPAQWKAKVLEVRALDSEHVYIRVAWLNRPEDLSSGRKPYHGKNELIPSNQIDVIDAMAVNGTVEVEHWDERDDDSALMSEDKFFWRQTYDFAGAKTLSALRLICVDKAPQNPDEMILQCGNQECREWQHVKCIAEAAVEEAASGAATSKRQKRESPKAIMIETQSSALARAEKNSIAAEVFIKGLPQGEGRAPAKTTEIVITRPDQQRQPVQCLFCGTEIE